MMKSEEEDKSELEIPSLVNNLLGPFIGFIKNVININFPDFKISKNVWILLGILIILITIKVQFVPLDSILVTLFGLIFLDLLGSNFPKIIQFFSSETKKNKFLENLDKKNIEELMDFISKTKLTLNDIKVIYNSRFKKRPEIDRQILRYQDYDADFIEFFVEEKLYEHSDSETFAFIIAFAKYKLPKEIFLRLLKITDGYSRGALLVRNNSFINKSKKIQHFIFSPVLFFCDSYIYFVSNGGLLLVSAIFSMFSLISSDINTKITNAGTNSISVIFAIIVTFIILLVIFMLLLRKISNIFLKILFLTVNKIYNKIDF